MSLLTSYAATRGSEIGTTVLPQCLYKRGEADWGIGDEE